MAYSESEKEDTERSYANDRLSHIDEAMARCNEAASLVHEAWDTLRNRIDPIVRPAEPTDLSENAMKELRDLESIHRQNLNGHAARLESLAASIRSVIDRLDV